MSNLLKGYLNFTEQNFRDSIQKVFDEFIRDKKSDQKMIFSAWLGDHGCRAWISSADDENIRSLSCIFLSPINIAASHFQVSREVEPAMLAMMLRCIENNKFGSIEIRTASFERAQ